MKTLKQTREPSRPYVLIACAVGLTIAVVAGLFFSGFFDTWFEDGLRHLTALRHFADTHHVEAIIVFFAVYVVLVALCFPGAIWLSIVGGFLFGLGEGIVYATLAATAGATCAFLLARYVFKNWIRLKTGKYLDSIKGGFNEDAFNYLVVLRLMPGCPFVAVNVAVAALDIRLKTYVLATLTGLFPSCIAHALIGVGLRELITAQPHLTPADLTLNPSITAGFFGLAALAAIPIAYRHFTKKPAL